MEYCSAECLDKANNQYHQILCLKSKAREGAHPVERINDVWKYGILEIFLIICYDTKIIS